MRNPATSLPALVLKEADSGGRVAYLAADLDRTFGRSRLPDHARLLANLVRWSANDVLPLNVSGAGFLDCHLYRQANRMILHLVNLSGFETGSAPAYEHYAVGPITVRLPADASAWRVKLLVSGDTQEAKASDGSVNVTIDRIVDHEVLVLEPK